jgi:hypothetical protein
LWRLFSARSIRKEGYCRLSSGKEQQGMMASVYWAVAFGAIVAGFVQGLSGIAMLVSSVPQLLAR